MGQRVERRAAGRGGDGQGDRLGDAALGDHGPRASCSTASVPGAHGGTYGGNAVACAAAVATLDVIEDEHLVENAERQGARLLEGIRRAGGAAHARRGGARPRPDGRASSSRTARQLAPRPDLASGLLAAARERHLLLLSCGTWGQVVRIIPPLVTTDEEVERRSTPSRESLDAIGA